MDAEKFRLQNTPLPLTPEKVEQLYEAANGLYDQLSPEQKADVSVQQNFEAFLKASTEYFNAMDSNEDADVLTALAHNFHDHYNTFLQAFKENSTQQLPDIANNHIDTTTASNPEESSSEELPTDPRPLHEIRGLYSDNEDWRAAVSYPPIGDVYPPKPIEVLKADVTAMFEAIPNLDVDKYLGVDTQFKTLVRFVTHADNSKDETRINKIRELWVRQINGLLKDAQAKAGLYQSDHESRQTISFEESVAAAGVKAAKKAERIALKNANPTKEETQVTEITPEDSRTAEEKLATLETKTKNLSDFTGQYLTTLEKNPELLTRINQTIASCESFFDSYHTLDVAHLNAKLRLVDKMTRELLKAVSDIEVHAAPTVITPDIGVSAKQPDLAQETGSPNPEQTPAQRQQNKIIGVILHNDSNILSFRQLEISNHERNVFFDKVRTGEINEDVLEEKVINNLHSSITVFFELLTEMNRDEQLRNDFKAMLLSDTPINSALSKGVEPQIADITALAARYPSPRLFNQKFPKYKEISYRLFGKRYEYWEQCQALLAEARTSPSEKPAGQGPVPDAASTPGNAEHVSPGPSERAITRESYKEAEATYLEALKTHYQEQSLLSKGVGWSKSLFGIKPKLPSSIEGLKNEANDARRQYAEALKSALDERRSKQDKEITVALADNINKKFAQRFILGRIKNQAQAQKEVFDIRKQTVLGKVIGTLLPPPPGLNATAAEHEAYRSSSLRRKWLTRAAVLSVAGLSGGVGAATYSAGRMIASTAVGGALAKAVYDGLKGRVEMAALINARAQYDVADRFTIEAMDNLEDRLQHAGFNLVAEERRQKAATVLAAGAVGFGTGQVYGNVADMMSSGEISFPTHPEMPFSTTEESSDIGSTAATAEVNQTPESPELHTVVKGDTLWELVEEHYKNELDAVAPQLRNQVLDTVFERIQADVSLRNNISPDLYDVEMIRIGQELDLSSIHDTLEQVIAEKTHAVPLSSGALNLENVDTSEAQSIPIETSPSFASAPIAPLTIDVVLNNDVTAHYSLSNITIQLEHPSEALVTFEQSVHTALQNILPQIIQSNPNIDTDSLEEKTLFALNERLQSYDWWRQAGVQGIDLSNIEMSAVEQTKTSTMIDTFAQHDEYENDSTNPEAEKAETTPTFEAPPNSISSDFDRYTESLYGSERSFNRAVEVAAQKLENQHRSSLLGLSLGPSYEHPLTAFGDMSLSEFHTLASSGSEGIRAFANDHNIRYEAIVGTANAAGLEQIINAHRQDYLDLTDDELKTTTVGDVFKHYVASEYAARRAAETAGR